MKKVIFWDFDGTMVKANKRFVDSLNFTLRKFGYCLDLSILDNTLKEAYPWLNYQNSYVGKKDLWWDNFLKKLFPIYASLNIDESVIEKINQEYKTRLTTHNDYEIYPDAKFVLQECAKRGYSSYLLSNNFPELPFFVNSLGISEYLDGVIISSHVGYEKPRKELFDFAIRNSGCDFGIMVGDNPIADIRGGKEVGLKTILVHNTVESAADYTFETLTQILSIL